MLRTLPTLTSRTRLNSDLRQQIEQLQQENQRKEQVIQQLLSNQVHQSEQIQHLQSLIENLVGRIGFLENNSSSSQRIFSNMLLEAAQFGSEELYHRALKNGAMIAAQDKAGNTALHIAALNNQPKIATLLLEKEPSLFLQRNNDGYTPIKLMSFTNNLAVLEWLCGLGKLHGFLSTQESFNDVFFATNSKETKLFLANWRLLQSVRDLAAMQDALIKGAEVNVKNHAGETALYQAVIARHVEAIRLLLKHGADPLLCNNQHGEMITQHHTVLDLIKNESNQELVTLVSSSYLMAAVQCGSIQGVEGALLKGASISYIDSLGQSALHKAVMRDNNFDIIILLLKKCVSEGIQITDLIDAEGRTPCDLAKESGVDVQTDEGSIRLDLYILEKFGYLWHFRKEKEKTPKLSMMPNGFIADIANVTVVSNPTQIEPEVSDDKEAQKYHMSG